MNKDAEVYEMCVHPFGAISSPSVAGYALRKSAADNAHLYEEDAVKAVLRNFYVDDLCKSEVNTDKAISIIEAISNICRGGGFNLTKLVSNSSEVLQSIPIERRVKELQTDDFSAMDGLVKPALGVVWNVGDDTLGFRAQFSEKPMTRRVLLSDVSSCYDPDGRGSAFIFPGKKILQEVTAENADWDSMIASSHKRRLDEWKEDMLLLETMDTPRCYTPIEFGQPVSQSLHCFSDGSFVGYGTASYLRSVNNEGKVHVSLVTAKSRVTPLKQSITIPRVEVTAAAVSVQVSAFLLEELDIPDLPVTFWTDSAIVLGYIANETKRFKTFVANRISIIHQYSSVKQWRHVPSDQNPADFTYRGLSPRCKEKVKMYFNGPYFLWNSEEKWPDTIFTPVADNNIELKSDQISVNKIGVGGSVYLDIISQLETRISSWHKLVRVLAYIVRFIKIIKHTVEQRKNANTSSQSTSLTNPEGMCGSFSLTDIQAARRQVFQLMQEKYLPHEFDILKRSQNVTNKTEIKGLKKKSTLYKLDPFINKDGLISVGGRLKHSKNSNSQILSNLNYAYSRSSCSSCALWRIFNFK